jgi:four helix bundle protein
LPVASCQLTEERWGGRGGNYRELIAWKKGIAFVVAVYAATRSWPKDEQYGLTNQIRRAAVSVPSNIAEGQGRASDNDFHRFLGMALGSLCEVEKQLTIGHELGYVDRQTLDRLDQQAAEVGRLLNGLMRSLRPPVPS